MCLFILEDFAMTWHDNMICHIGQEMKLRLKRKFEDQNDRFDS
jgi:hypothetical protein